MNFNDVQVYLDTEMTKGNEDVKNYLSGLVPVTNESATTFLETEEGKQLLQPMLDKYHDKSLKSWQTNNLDNLVDERTAARIKELYPDESPEERKIKELEVKLQNQQKEIERSKLKENAIKKIKDAGISDSLVHLVIGSDEKETIENVELLKKELRVMANNEVDKRLSSSYRPPGATGHNSSDLANLDMKNYIKKRKEKG